MTLYELTLPTLVKNLRNMERWLDRTIAYAGKRKFDPDVLVTARLAPDAFSFARQVQAACDTAKLAAAKLAGKEPPPHPDTEKTVEELRARIRTCLAYLETIRPDDFEGADERICKHAWMMGMGLRGPEYVRHYALPNFLFHCVMAYGILRHNGVDLGKSDYLGELPLQK